MDTADEHTRCGPRRKVVMWRYFPGEVGNLEADVVVTAKYLAASASLRQAARTPGLGSKLSPLSRMAGKLRQEIGRRDGAS